MPARRKSIEEIVATKIHKTETCWLWTGGLSSQGYGVFGGRRYSKTLAHRAMLQLTGVVIPDGMVVDHTCMNRICVNPLHLRIVTKGINATENSNSAGAINKLKTHCKRGHEFTKENTKQLRRGWRECKQCRILPQARQTNQRRINRSHGKSDETFCKK